MKKYYEEDKYNAAFDRCADVMCRMLQKYGHLVLDKLEQEAPQMREHPVNEGSVQPSKEMAA